MTEFVEGTFLGLTEGDGQADIAILSVPYELTTSYGQGTCEGPKATLQASAQVELYDPLLPKDLPCGFTLHTCLLNTSTSPRHLSTYRKASYA